MRKLVAVAIALAVGGMLLFSGHQSAHSDAVEIPVDQVWDAWIAVDEPCPPLSPLPSGTTVVGIDTDTADNWEDSLGTIDRCISAESVETGPDMPGPVFDIDVFVDEIPSVHAINVFEYYFNFDEGTMVNQDHVYLLDLVPGSLVLDLSDAVPDSESPHYVGVVDLADPPADEAGPISGVLGRYTFDVSDAAAGRYHVSLTGILLAQWIPETPELVVTGFESSMKHTYKWGPGSRASARARPLAGEIRALARAKLGVFGNPLTSSNGHAAIANGFTFTPDFSGPVRIQLDIILNGELNARTKGFGVGKWRLLGGTATADLSQVLVVNGVETKKGIMFVTDYPGNIWLPKSKSYDQYHAPPLSMRLDVVSGHSYDIFGGIALNATVVHLPAGGGEATADFLSGRFQPSKVKITIYR